MKKPFDLNLDKPDLYQCGRVAVWSSMLDQVMEVAIWVLLDLPRADARRMTHGTPAMRKCQLLTFFSQTKGVDAKAKKELQAIVEEIGKVLTERNLVIHGWWHVGHDNKPWVAKYSENGKPTYRQLDAPLVAPIAETAKSLAVRLARWVEARDPLALTDAFPKEFPDSNPKKKVEPGA